MTALSVNVNKIALLRNQRTVGVPSVPKFARIAVDAGADGITVHPRPDERHVRRSDVRELAAMLRGAPRVEFNIEGNPFEGPFMDLVSETRPHQCTLVPDAPGQATSDHGWDLARDGARLRPVLAELRALGIRSSLFVDPDPAAPARARDTGADRVEIYTEGYARAFAEGRGDASLAPYAATAAAARAAGLGVNAGHDLNLENLRPFLRAVPGVLEVSIGHALVADALELGLAGAVRAYRERLT